MNLSEMLGYADIGLLSAIARHYNCDCNSHSKNELIQTILTTLNRRDTFEQQLHDLKDEDIRLMNRLLFDKRSYFSIEELLAIVKQTGRQRREMAGGERKDADQEVNPRETIIRFKQRGWLFNGHSQQTKYLYRIPEDVKRRFSDCYTSYLSRQLVHIDNPAAYRDEQMIIGQDVLRFLRYVYQHEIELTIDGTMYKRSLHQILSLLHVQEEAVKTRGWRFGYGRKFREYPDRFSLIYDYCYYSGLIEEQTGKLVLTEQGEQRVKKQVAENPMDMYKLWLKLYKGAIPNLQALVHWLQRLCGRWTTVQSLHEALGRMIQPFYFDTPQQVLELRIIRMMMHLGLLQLGDDPTCGPVVRMTKLGEHIIGGTYVPEEEKIELDQEPRLTWEQLY
jgi:hypothetical protein